MTKIEKVKLGQTGLEVLKLGLGAAPFASACYGEVSVNNCEMTLKRAIEEGVTYIDTAPWYGNGRISCKNIFFFTDFSYLQKVSLKKCLENFFLQSIGANL